MIIKAVENVENVMDGASKEDQPPSARTLDRNRNVYINNRREWDRDDYIWEH